MNFITKNFFGIVILILFFMFMFSNTFSGCRQKIGSGDIFGGGKPDTTITVVQTPQPIVVLPPQIPQQSGNTVYPVVIPPQYNPSADMAELRKQYQDLTRQFLASKNYKDSFQLKDTAGNRVGVVNLNQTVSENELKSTQPSYQLSFPHTYTTITKPYDPKRQLYWGGGLMGSPSSFVDGAKVGLMYKDKKDQQFGIEGGAKSTDGKVVPHLGINYYRKF